MTSLTREVFLFLSGLIIARLLVATRLHITYSRSRELEGFFKNLITQRPRIREVVNVTPTLLASHSIAFSLFILLATTLFTTRGVSLEKCASTITLHLYIQPTLLAISLLYSQRREPGETLLLGLFSGAGLLGVLPLLSALPRKTLHIKPAKRAFYTEPIGIFVGVAEAEMIYDKPHEVYTEIPQEHVLSARGRETWFFRETRQPIYVKLEDLNTPHIVVIGASGTGKTTLVKHLVLESNRVYGYRFLIIDPHGEYSDLAERVPCRVIDASKYSINPLVLENTPPRDRALQLSHVLASIFKLGFIQRRLLEEVILKAYANKGVTEDPETWRREPPTLRDLTIACKELSELNPEYLRVLPYLNLISESMGEGSPLSIEDLLRENSIIDLSRVSSDFAKAILVETLMYMLISKMYRAKRMPLQLVIDEIRHIMPRALGVELLSRIFMESRKFGFSTIVVSQDIKRVPRALVNNAGLRVFFALNEPESVKIAADIIGGTIKVKNICISEALRALKQHTFILHATGSENIYIARSILPEE